MSKLKELVSRGVRLIVQEVPAGGPDSVSPEREFPPEAFAEAQPRELSRSDVPADVEDFAAVYREAGVELPAHGYGVDRVSEMLQSKHLSQMTREVKAASVMAALEAAKVPMRDVLQDAVARDRALDGFEEAKGREVGELRARTEGRVQAIKEEIDAFLQAKNAELAALKQAEAAASEALARLQGRKRREEERLYDVIAHFVAGPENPITTSAAQAAPPPPPPKPDQA
jgi:hypothetical protein